MSFNAENQPISWDRFRRAAFFNDGPRCSFWEWFYAAMKLTRHHLSEAWKKNYIAGFVSREEAREMLMERGPGTFLLRFSEDVRGKNRHLKKTNLIIHSNNN